MSTFGIELCDAGFEAATFDRNASHDISVLTAGAAGDWPGFAYFDGEKFTFGRAAEDQWFVHPRRVTHTFWARLAHEPSTVGFAHKPAVFSELAYRFFEDYVARALGKSPAGKIVLAVPGAYLKDAATEEEKIGLLLGIAGDLKLPLAGIIDMAGAALCDPRSRGFNPALPVVVLDLHLEGADITLLGTDERLERKDFIHLPHSGLAQLLKHLTGTMGNRFLRHTAFDILEDGRIEQTFYRQTKDFILGGTAEYRFQINTASRAYEMLAKREQLVSDAQAFTNTLVQGLQAFLQNSTHASEPCTIALTDRTAHLPGIETRLRAAGFQRILRLPAGAAACGAARFGEENLDVACDLCDVPVATAVPMTLAHRAVAAPWEARLQKLSSKNGPRPTPTHVILDGIGHAITRANRFTIGAGPTGADLSLPDTFGSAEDCTIPILREGGRLWFVDATAARANASQGPAARTAIEAGDRLVIRCGPASADVLFAHVSTTNGARAHD